MLLFFGVGKAATLPLACEALLQEYAFVKPPLSRTYSRNPVHASSENALNGAGEVRPSLSALFRLAFTILRGVRFVQSFFRTKHLTYCTTSFTEQHPQFVYFCKNHQKNFFPQKHSANVLEKPAISRLAFTVLKVVRHKIKFKASKNTP